MRKLQIAFLNAVEFLAPKIRLVLSAWFTITCFHSSVLLGFVALGLFVSAELQTIINRRMRERLTVLENAILPTFARIKVEKNHE